MTNEEIRDKVLWLQSTASESRAFDDVEMQDVVDNDGVVVGSLSRGVIWDNGLENYTRVVNIFVQNKKEEILLPIRSMNKRYLPGGYDFSCGENVLSGESFVLAASRGLKEELGVEGCEIEKRGSFALDKDGGFFCFGEVYLAKVYRDMELKVNVEEVDRYDWKSVDYIRGLMVSEEGKFKRDYKAVFEMVFGKKVF